MVNKQVSLRISTVGGKEAIATFEQIGNQGSAGLNRLAAAQEKVGGISAQTGNQVRNAAFQFNDFFVQVGAGTSVTQALGQQLPQLLQGFGLFGAVAGLAAAAMVPLIGYLSSAGTSAEDLRNQVEGLSATVDDYKSAVEAANISTSDLQLAFGDASFAVGETLRLLREIAAGDAQDAIDNLASSLSGLLGTGGAGDQRAELASFFDVNIMLAFTDAQREAREEARLLTSQFQEQQQELAAAEGNIDAQIEALSDLLSTTRQLANETDGVNEEERALITSMRDALVAMVEQKRTMGEVKTELELATEAAIALFNTAASNDWLAGAIARAATLAQTLWGAAAAAAVALSQPVPGNGPGFERGGRMGSSPGIAPTVLPTLDDLIERNSGGRGGGGGRRGGGGGGGRDPNADDLRDAARLFEQTRTEAEKYATELANIDRLLSEGDITADTHARAVENLAEKYGDAAEQGLTFKDAITDISDSLITAARNGESLADALGQAFADIAADLASTQLQRLLLNAFGPILGNFGLSLDSPIMAAGQGLGLGGAQAARAASAGMSKAAANTNSGMIVNIHGGNLSKDDVVQSQGPNGQRQLDIYVEGIVQKTISNGKADRQLAAAFGIKRVGR